MKNKLIFALIFGILLIGMASATITVTLNSPADGITNYTNPLTFNATATITGGTTLANMTLWDDRTGTWSARNNTSFNTLTGLIYQNTTSVSQSYDPDVIYTLKKEITINGNVTYGQSTGRKAGGGTHTILYQFIYLDNSQENVTSSALTDSDVNYTFTNPNVNKLVSTIKIYLSDDTSSSTIESNTMIYGLPINSLLMNYYNTYSSGQLTKWNVQACDSDGACGFATANRTFSNLTVFESIYLISPVNNTILTSSISNFSANLTISGVNQDNYTWKNSTYNIFYENGTLFNSTTLTIASLNQTNNSVSIGGFVLGNYLWGVRGCYGNITFSNCTNSLNNTFLLGASLLSLSYNNNTYETANENFIASFSILSGSQIALAQLIYNGTAYPITNLTIVGTTLTLQKAIDIPLNANGTINETKTFKFRFTYGGGVVQDTAEYSQNVSFIRLIQCGSPYTTQALNFTLYDEVNQTNINATANPITLESNFQYWLGTGSIYKNYTFQNLSSSLGNYQFCIYPYLPNNYTFKVDSSLAFSASNYREDSYFLRNATLTNTSNNILLYLLHNDVGTKFFLTFRQGINPVSNGIITVQKYFVGLGSYQTVSILSTDDDGQTTMWQEVDKTYRYSVVKNGVLLGVPEKVSICSVAPCKLTLTLNNDIPSAFESYDELYAANILSNLSFGYTTKIVTYSFIDITGLANYFRLEVVQTKVNAPSVTICNVYSYSSAGTLTCNVTGYEGDFSVKTYISRSPEKLDKIISFLIDPDVIKDLGLNGALIVVILVITFVIAAAVMSRGNPSVVLFVFGFIILALKLIGIMPLGWVTIVVLEVLVIWLLLKLKS